MVIQEVIFLSIFSRFSRQKGAFLSFFAKKSKCEKNPSYSHTSLLHRPIITISKASDPFWARAGDVVENFWIM